MQNILVEQSSLLALLVAVLCWITIITLSQLLLIIFQINDIVA